MNNNRVDLGQIHALLSKLGGMNGVLALLSGRAELAYRKHVIDLDADPFIPSKDWKLLEHRRMGKKFLWDTEKVALFLHPDQQSEYAPGATIPHTPKRIKGEELMEKVKNEKVFNANLLDYLLDHPYLIPEEWKLTEQGKPRSIFFWGTIYKRDTYILHVRTLEFSAGHWKAGYEHLNTQTSWLREEDPALVEMA